MNTLASLRIGGTFLVMSAFWLGLIAASLWFTSNARWTAHLNDARFAGAVLYESLESSGTPPQGIDIQTLAPADQALAATGRFEAISDVPQSARVTNFSIRPSPTGGRTANPLTVAILSSDLRYPLANVSTRSGQTSAETLGALTSLLATYCSNPVLIAQLGEGPWVRIEGQQVWNCSVAPKDLRLFAVALALVSVGILTTIVLNSSAQFQGFAQMLRARNKIGGPESYEANGPFELRDIVSAVNGYLEVERDRLAERVAVLSGVSHDLGTPATRLKLRTALIQDSELRAKLESDIDAMTGIIESVLTYTRAELDAEQPRRISLTSLIESVVADYQDVGSPVEFHAAEKVTIEGGQSVFMSRRGTRTLPPDDKVVVNARPVALNRAVSNLIDNALKYGRRAKIGLEKDADSAVITIEDEGGSMTIQDIEDLMAPFKRGSNTKLIGGHGLGLTIVSTIAKMHGGSLKFEPAANGGLLAKITIQRQ
ncbi:sensor histidine kinase [Cognatiyoonia sp.]|uniref:sensor histidine kinase n=1 Tax=Cognatiyoonia sp. TaxID=2211652 RepID=UPI003F69A3C3